MHITTIIGNLGGDPEIRELKNGSKVANLSVAVNEYRGKDEEPITYWYRVTAWGENAKTSENLSKGDRIVVVGKMVTRKYEDKNGDTKYSTDLVADDWRGVVALAPAPEAEKKSKGRAEERSGDRKRRLAEELDDSIPF
jgi:single-strand DNA-binding protein